MKKVLFPAGMLLAVVLSVSAFSSVAWADKPTADDFPTNAANVGAGATTGAAMAEENGGVCLVPGGTGEPGHSGAHTQTPE